MRLCNKDTGRANGFYRPADKLIAVSDRLSGDQRTKTLVHEAAHFMADHRGSVARADAETVAESSAFVVLGRYGVDAGSYTFPYVARWARDKAVLRRNLAEVQGVAAGLIAGIEEVRLIESWAPGLLPSPPVALRSDPPSRILEEDRNAPGIDANCAIMN